MSRSEAAARRNGEGFGGPIRSATDAASDSVVRERATASRELDPAELAHGACSANLPSISIALLPLIVVMAVNPTMSLLVLPRLDTDFLAEPRWGGTSIASVGGLWSLLMALSAAIVVLFAFNRIRLQSLRDTVDAGLNASAPPIISAASLWSTLARWSWPCRPLWSCANWF